MALLIKKYKINFGPKVILCTKKVLGKKRLGLKETWSTNVFSPKKIQVEKNSSKKIFHQKNFRSIKI